MWVGLILGFRVGDMETVNISIDVSKKVVEDIIEDMVEDMVEDLKIVDISVEVCKNGCGHG